jgi:hypothetical protein
MMFFGFPSSGSAEPVTIPHNEMMSTLVIKMQILEEVIWHKRISEIVLGARDR